VAEDRLKSARNRKKSKTMPGEDDDIPKNLFAMERIRQRRTFIVRAGIHQK
jgi:hypothetical protein